MQDTRPMDHWQRIEAAIHNQPTDRLPIALWRHFPDDDLFADKLTSHTLDWQRKWDFDLVKFMPPGTYGVEDWGAVTAYRGAANGAREVIQPAVKSTEDWARLPNLDVRKGSYGQQNRALAATAAALKGKVPLLQTVFSPLTTARKLGTEQLFADMRCAPEALEQALRVITDVTIRFALDALNAGAHGIFLASQLASHRLMTEAEYQRFGQRYDLEVLTAIQGRSRLNMLHAHGEDIMFELMCTYPVEMLNWHDRRTRPSLHDAAQSFPRLLVGGVAEHGTLLQGNAQAIEAEVQDAWAQTAGRRLLLAPGCVLPVATSDARIEALVQASRRCTQAEACTA